MIYDLRQASYEQRAFIFYNVFCQLKQMIENRYSESPLRETAIAALGTIYHVYRQKIIADMNCVICEKHMKLLIVQYL